MDNTAERQVDNYCRACFNRFKEQKNETTESKQAIFPCLAEKFLACTNLLASENDELSHFLCGNCCNELIKFHAFQEMCSVTMDKFRRMLCAVKQITSKTEYSHKNEPGPIVEQNLNKSKLWQSKSETSIPVAQRKNDESYLLSSVVEDNAQNNELSKEMILKAGKSYLCETCPTRFFVEHCFKAHIRSHAGLMPYPCPHENCERGFNRYHCLQQHLRQHEGTNKLYTCKEPNCEKSYQHKTSMEMHMRRFHKKGALKTFVCEICGKLFKSAAILNNHFYTHKDKSELPFACEKPGCKQRFSSKEKLKIHLWRHAGVKKFECPHCGMKKTTRNELKIHINYHTLERTYPCRFCTQVCNSAGNLKVHIRTMHERAKDYNCRFCERSFAKPDTRKYHEMIHTGEKQHECNECGKRFVQPAALRTHRKIHLRKQTQMNGDQQSVEPSGIKGVRTQVINEQR